MSGLARGITGGGTVDPVGAYLYDVSSGLWLPMLGAGGLLQIAPGLVLGALAPGTNLIGKVGIDQVTAHANEVVNIAGSAAIGTVGITPMVAAATNVNVSAAGAAAVITKVADATHKHQISGLAWSYSGGIPTAGRLTIEDVAANIVFDLDITEDGPDNCVFVTPVIGAAVNTAMIITLAAAGAGIVGKVNLIGYKLI